MAAPSKPTHSDIYDALEELREQLSKVVDRLGHESDDGRTGTGLTGRIMRTEAKVLAYDKLKERVVGGLMTASVFLAVLWWLARDKLAAVFGVSG